MEGHKESVKLLTLPTLQGSGKPLTTKAKTVHAQTGVERDSAYYS
ncbi:MULTISPECIES: hypothetical protein [Butyricimonas]|nr:MULTISPECIES: hypothetical protein [Butyricimonas]